MKQSHRWRFIPLLSAPGNLQMAIDKWLLSQHQHHNYPSILRFYEWHPVAISLGVSQKKSYPGHWHDLQWQGKSIDIVQRPSGGRGVLHQGDLTYSVISSQFEGNLDEVYRQISQFLIVGWGNLGLDLHFGAPHRQYLKSANCFALSTNADLVDSQGNKFIGSAQLKQGKFVLQHGSMVLEPDLELYQQVFGGGFTPYKRVNLPSCEEIMASLKGAAQLCFNCEFDCQPLTDEEMMMIKNGQLIMDNG